MENRAISMHRSMAGMPTLISGVSIFWLALIAPELVRKEIRIVCQKLRKMTSLMASTFRIGLCCAISALIWT